MPTFGVWSVSSATSLSAALCARPAERRPIRRSALLLTDMLGDILSPKLRLSPATTDQNIIRHVYYIIGKGCAALGMGTCSHLPHPAWPERTC